MAQHPEPMAVYNASATAMLFTGLFAELDQRGIIPMAEVAKKLVRLAEETEKSAHPDLPLPRLDCQILRQIAERISGPPGRPPRGWTPIVIEGG